MSDTRAIVSCPHCQTRMRVPASGQNCACPKCGKQIKFAAPAAVPSVKPVAKPKTAPPSKPASQPVASFPGVPMSPGANLPQQVMPPMVANAGNNAQQEPNNKKLWVIVGASVFSLVFLSIFVGVAVFLLINNGTATDNSPVAAAPQNVAPPPVAAPADPNALPEMPEKRPAGATPYVGLDQIIYKGETLGPAEEGSGKRVIGVGKSMQPNEVRSVMWRITGIAGGGSDRKNRAEQQLRSMAGYVHDSLVIDSQKQVVLLKYKGTVLTARDYRTILELEAELTLDPEPHFP